MLGIITGTGLNKLLSTDSTTAARVNTPYGETSGELIKTEVEGQPLVLLPRHGQQHSVPPHLINYRANIWALKEAGVKQILAFAAVGGIAQNAAPGTLVLPEQIIDYTYGREQTFFTENFSPDQHIDFTWPYNPKLRKLIAEVAAQHSIKLVPEGVYACTQGPRLETAAEVQKLKQDGCSIVGMTAMPEAALAREVMLDYATLAIVVNWAAGLSEDLITIEMIQSIAQHAEQDLLTLVQSLAALID